MAITQEKALGFLSFLVRDQDMEVRPPDPQSTNPKAHHSYCIVIDNEAAAGRVIADFIDGIKAHKIERKSRGNSGGDDEFDGHIWIHEDIIQHPNFIKLMQDREFHLDVQDSLRKREPDDDEYPAIRRATAETDRGEIVMRRDQQRRKGIARREQGPEKEWIR